MKIVFIGAGNLASNLAIELKKQSFDIVQVFSRTIESATLLASQIGCTATNDIDAIHVDADLYIFSVKDTALSTLLAQMKPNKGVWVHTAGSIALDVFEGYCANYGVVYPFQTFSKNRQLDFSKIPFFLEANNQETLNFLKSIFTNISEKQLELSSEKRKYIHLTGVFACNFVNHLYRISQDILENEQIPFDVILPLIEETAAKVQEMSPTDAQTGPAIRFDENVINKHLSLINDARRKQIYQLMSEDIHEANNK